MTPAAQKRYLCASKGLAIKRNAERLISAIRDERDHLITGLFRVLAYDLDTLRANNDELYYMALENILKAFKRAVR
jgi:hypothetical protein